MEQNGAGFVKVSEEVINKIAYTATLETEGVTAVVAKKVNAKQIIKGMKMPKGISYQTTEEGLEFDVSVAVSYGTKIQEVAAAIQTNIRNGYVEVDIGLNCIYSDNQYNEYDCNNGGDERELTVGGCGITLTEEGLGSTCYGTGKVVALAVLKKYCYSKEYCCNKKDNRNNYHN